MGERTERTDFRATSDPALLESADRGEAHLLTNRELYRLWERQQWATQDLDFTQDRIDWHERIDPEERYQRMYGLSAFFVGEQRVAAELGPMMRAAPDEEMRLFMCTQIADGVLRPPWMEGDDEETTIFGVSLAETRAFAMKGLERRMKVIGLLQAA